MKKKTPSRKKKKIPLRIDRIVGFGLDNDDGHTRITTGEKFVLEGGSEETHARMTETVVKTFEELKRRHKPLEAVEPTELIEIIHKSTPR